uniref:ABC transporter ATP-binding protein n=1 Tax=Marinobacterium profundum TaxID=1714300 RepID=UPI00082EFFA0|nr:sn-glycerol-3-phosphate ABC transporter ATP-binding protein UgpC [Marinobacterium profundum]
MSSVTLSNIKKSYGDVSVIQGIDLAINNGEFIVLVGPSGCGKSTLLRMIAGLESISGGTLSIGGDPMNDVHARDRDIAMVFQSYALYPHMSVRDNIAFALKMRGVDPARIEREVANAAEILSLGHLLDRLPRELSGGQRQRVAMGRAIVRHPKVFLFDEPLSNLDAKLRVQMRVEIRELHQRLQATSVFVTHDQVEAMTMADRIVLLNDGVIQQFGTPLELYDYPCNRFVAAFIGSPGMNFVDGTIEHEEGIAALSYGDGRRIELNPEMARLPAAGQAVTLGFRPEHLQPCAKGQGFETLITSIETTGFENYLYCEAQGVRMCALQFERLDCRVGDSIHLRPAADKLHFFDQVTGLRLESEAPLMRTAS